MAKVSDEYEDLLHYTNANGLTGILQSQSIWATHYSFLNDSEEVAYYFDTRLKDLIGDSFISIEKELIDRVINELAQSFKRNTMDINEAYIFSMCGSKYHAKSAHEDGLLSQWRGYGSDGGYAIVFDARGIENILSLESKVFHYQNLTIADVKYHDKNDISEEIKEAESILTRFIDGIFKSEKYENHSEAYDAITFLSCIYKHAGFHEEQEVRVVAMPTHKIFLEGAIKIDPKKQIKQVQSIIKDGQLIPYINLFGSQNASDMPVLPIKRIIVGPHRDKYQRKEALDILLEKQGMNIPVTVSGIPYIGK